MKRILNHNVGGFSAKERTEQLYLVVQESERNLFGECTNVLRRTYDKALWVALMCLGTAQRDSDLKHQPQTKRIAGLVFHNTVSKADEKWFVELFPEAGKWKHGKWFDMFTSNFDTVNGILFQAPIIKRAEWMID